MREYHVKVYEDMFVVAGSSDPGGQIVPFGELEKRLTANGADPKPIKRKGRPRGLRKALGRGVEAATGAPEA